MSIGGIAGVLTSRVKLLSATFLLCVYLPANAALFHPPVQHVSYAFAAHRARARDGVLRTWPIARRIAGAVPAAKSW
jgi:hypothetical protein